MCLLTIITYIMYIIIFIFFVINPAVSFIRMKHIGRVFDSFRLSKDRYMLLALGVFMLLIGFLNIFLLLYIKKNFSLSLLLITPFVIGISSIEQFLTSKIYVGENGISIPKFPFYIKLEELKSCNLISNVFIISRKQKKDIRIAIEKKDINKLKLTIEKFSLEQK